MKPGQFLHEPRSEQEVVCLFGALLADIAEGRLGFRPSTTPSNHSARRVDAAYPRPTLVPVAPTTLHHSYLTAPSSWRSLPCCAGGV